MPSSHKKALVAVLGVAVLVAGGVYYMNMQTAPGPADDTTEPVDSNDTQETNRSVGLTAAQIEGEIYRVNITDIKAEPASIEIAPEDGIRFVNQAGVDVQFSFDREIGNFTLAAGEESIVDPESIIYYQVTPVDEDAEFRDISARINVQG